VTEKQKRFCDEYLIDLNATQAAIRAGYSEKYAHTNATKLLQNTTLKKYIEARLKKKEEALIAKQDEILQYLTAVMRGEYTEETLCLAGEGTQEVEKIEVSAKDRLKAAELLGKRYALFTDKVDVDTDMNLNITIDYGDGNGSKTSGK